ncbi:MAG: hypothetical protein ABR609_02670 [Acidimicrobiia bacterium]
MEINQALDIIASAGLVFEVVYAGDGTHCPLCLRRETQQAA